MEELPTPPLAAPMPPPPPAPFTAAPAPAVDRTPLRELARRQRMAIIAGILNAVGGVLMATDTTADGLAALFVLIVAGFVIFAAFRLGQQLYGAGIGVLSGIAMLIPLVWIGVLVVLSSRASRQLRAAGVKVGFLGADPASI
jgi:hypothetical protein